MTGRRWAREPLAVPAVSKGRVEVPAVSARVEAARVREDFVALMVQDVEMVELAACGRAGRARGGRRCGARRHRFQGQTLKNVRPRPSPPT